MDPATVKAAEEIAKTTGQALEIVHDTGGYLSQVFGELPTDLVGLGGAYIHEVHIRLRDKWRRRTEQILRDRDVKEAISLSPNVAAALVSGAQEEEREELAELWARLLANAMDPKLNNVRQSYIEVVKKMDPPDASVLLYMYEQGIDAVNFGRLAYQNRTIGAVDIGQALGHDPDEVRVSVEHLAELRILYQRPNLDAWITTAVFRRFMQACYPEVHEK